MSISLFRSIASQYQHLRRINTVAMMNEISHQIEDQVTQHQMAVDFYAGFQRFSNVPDQLRRYTRLGTICRRVYVFGIADHEPPAIPGVEFIDILPTSPLSREWFLLVDTPNFWTTLVSQEVVGKDPISGGRRFDGLWSYDETIVDRISLLISQVMEVDYQPVQRRRYDQQSLHISEINSRMIGMIEDLEQASSRRWSQLSTIQKVSTITSRSPLTLMVETAKILTTIFGAAGVAIAFKTSDNRYTIPVVEGEANGKGWKMPLTEGICGRAIQQSRLVQIMKVRDRNDIDILLPAAKSLISAPIIGKQLYGAVLVGHNQPQKWDSEDGQAMMTVTRILALQLEQTLTTAEGFLSLGPAKRLQKFIDQQQKSISSLLALQQALRASVNFAPQQVELLNQMGATSTDLVKATKYAKDVLNQSNNHVSNHRSRRL